VDPYLGGRRTPAVILIFGEGVRVSVKDTSGALPDATINWTGSPFVYLYLCVRSTVKDGVPTLR